MIDIEKMILELEKGYSNRKEDRGGPTKYGITLKTLQAHYSDYSLQAEDVKNLTVKEAVAVYRHEFIRKPRIDKLPAAIQQIVFDMCVNHGAGNAIRLLQRALRSYLKDSPSVDGRIGPKTIRAAEFVLESQGERALLEMLVALRVDFMKDIVKDDPTQKVFLNGWLNRAESFLKPKKEQKT